MKTCLPPSRNLAYMSLGLAGEAGEVANKVKKLIRDSNGRLTDEAKAELIKEVGDVLWYCAGMATVLDVNLADVAQANINKLKLRAAMGKIGGAGDNR
jgi:NTP pyrophosphatase (non-canonical NTP hydrolase)